MIKDVTALFSARRTGFSDQEVVIGLQNKDRRKEEWFFNACSRYFNEHFNEVFFDKDMKQEMFQVAFLKLWTEISDGKIMVADNMVCRRQRTGEVKVMTCSLLTFLMTFAKYEYREVVRSNMETDVPEIFDDAVEGDVLVTSFDIAEDEEELKNRIVDECMQQMSAMCLDVLTMYYYEGRSLDQIMEARNDRNSSKNGLKTAKNKCMNTLRSRVTAEFVRLGLNI